MKDKILPLFLYLYKKRKCTCRELANVLDCSPRTVMRLVDIITPDLPIMTLRGRRGGVILDEKYKL